ncbi:MAG: T9SS type A sorting domain-containing protein [Flavobacteriales bacterium]
MKELFLVTAIIHSACFIAQGQQLPNSSFEDWWEYAGNERPENWLDTGAALFCSPTPDLAVKSTDAHSGTYAVMIENLFCIMETGEPRVDKGRLFTGNSGLYPPLGFSMPYTAKPDSLKFFYKFHREGVDTGMVRLMLFTYDTINYEFLDTMALSIATIDHPTDEYLEFSMPISYHNELTPQYILIEFSGRNSPFAYGIPGIFASAGTKIWIDDISLVGGNVGEIDVVHFQNVSMHLSNNLITLNGISPTAVFRCEVFNSIGQKVLESENEATCSVASIVSGYYFLRLTQENSEHIEVFKFVK